MEPRPHAPATARNREPILAVLRTVFADRRCVLEIGSGSGEHAAYFAAAMPWLDWQASDVAEQLPGIRAWRAHAALPNLPAPLALDVRAGWPELPADAVFTASTLHIMGLDGVEAFFRGAGRLLHARPGAPVVAYGPFNRHGRYTSQSNRDFDASLKARDPRSGLRDVDLLDALAAGVGLVRVDDVAMPAHNACLVWRRRDAA